MDNLEHCPICGKTENLIIYSCGFERYEVRCVSCLLTMGPWHGLQTAIEAWNRRAKKDAVD